MAYIATGRRADWLVLPGRFLFLLETMRLSPVVLVLALTASACTHAVRPAERLNRSDETYEFNERVAGSNRTLRGTVHVMGDTAIVDAETGLCVYDVEASTGRNSMTYRCGDVTFTVDRTNPDLRVLYSFYDVVVESKKVCVQYTTSSQGQQVCARIAMESVERKVPVRGQVHTRAAEE